MFAEKTTLLLNDIEREKNINERRNVIEEELRSFDDEDALASQMDCDNYTRTSFPPFFLKERKQRKNLTGQGAAILF